MALVSDTFIGPEAEGHLKGVMTLFVKDGRPSATHRYPHLFFTKEFTNWEEVTRHLDLNYCLVTVEVWAEDLESIPYDILTRAHILVRLPFDLRMLKETDSLIVGGPYYGRAFQVGTGIETRPDDYVNDTRVAENVE